MSEYRVTAEAYEEGNVHDAKVADIVITLFASDALGALVSAQQIFGHKEFYLDLNTIVVDKT